jgi:hypothetical protein
MFVVALVEVTPSLSCINNITAAIVFGDSELTKTLSQSELLTHYVVQVEARYDLQSVYNSTVFRGLSGSLLLTNVMQDTNFTVSWKVCRKHNTKTECSILYFNRMATACSGNFISKHSLC